MKTLKPIGVRGLLGKTNLITIGIVITGVLSIVMGLLTYYGAYSGNFNIVLDPQDRYSSIMLSETEDFENGQPVLFADAVNDKTPIAYYQLPLKDIVETDGNFVDPNPENIYFAYSFYIMNNGEGDDGVDIESELIVEEVYQNLDKAIRVIIIKDKDIDNLSFYMKEDEVSLPNGYHPVYPDTTMFLNDEIVFQETIEDFKPGDKMKYTIITYLEGNDPDSDDSLYLGSIKMLLRFRIVDPV